MYDIEKIKQIPLPVIALQETGVTLKEHGNSRCPCPECGAKKTHFTYYAKNNTFNCWYSGTGGTSIDLIKHIKGITDNGDAIEYLKRVYLGGGAMEVPINPIKQTQIKAPTPPAKNDREVYTTLLDMCKGVHDTTIENYLDGRGIVEPLRERYNIRIIPAGGAMEVRKELIKRFGINRLKAAGVISVNGWFIFSDYRLLLPAMYGEKCVYVHGRLTDEQPGDNRPKYMYLGGVPRVPFLLDNLNSKAKYIYIVEGFFDAICATEMGKTAIGLGSCHYKEENFIWLLKKIQKKGKNIVIAYDNDSAGQKAIKKTMLDGKPINEFCAEIGLNAYSYTYNANLQGCKDWNEYYLLCNKCINNYLECTYIAPGEEPTPTQLIEQVTAATNAPRQMVEQIIYNL